MTFFEWLEKADYNALVNLDYFQEETRCQVCFIGRRHMIGNDWGGAVVYKWRHHKECPVMLGDALQHTSRWSRG